LEGVYLMPTPSNPDHLIPAWIFLCLAALLTVFIGLALVWEAGLWAIEMVAGLFGVTGV
jgi:hypothetical protein